jgi:hypothetical protein
VVLDAQIPLTIVLAGPAADSDLRDHANRLMNRRGVIACVDVAADGAKQAIAINLIILSSLLGHCHLGGVVHACSVPRVVVPVHGFDDNLTISFNCFLNFD